ncbi:MAG: hypothetical protein K8R02_00370 [Anaerohalosphaeraceae bacterium]|nr:hypothetical protein [Anaerohalosphaeraceae bacterium]
MTKSVPTGQTIRKRKPCHSDGRAKRRCGWGRKYGNVNPDESELSGRFRGSASNGEG